MTARANNGTLPVPNRGKARARMAPPRKRKRAKREPVRLRNYNHAIEYAYQLGYTVREIVRCKGGLRINIISTDGSRYPRTLKLGSEDATV